MKYIEKLLWILDSPDTSVHNLDKKIQENIAFVHSLGLKCDSVGWCELDLADSRIPEILKKITAFCRKNGRQARCIYTRRYIEVESDWYELVPTAFQDNTPVDCIQAAAESGETISIRVIRAFHESNKGVKCWGSALFVPERFRNVCIQNGYALEFCWAKDIGKYESEQYFHVYGVHLLPRVAVVDDMKQSKERLTAAEGWLPQIVDVFDTLQIIDMPDCYLAEDFPCSGIVYTHIPQTVSTVGRNTILIHKEIAKKLLSETAIPASCLRPAPVVYNLPGGYLLKDTVPMSRPGQAFMNQMLLEYEKLKANPRPVRMISEKEALRILRCAKKERTEDFQAAMPRAQASGVLNGEYQSVIPYYLVANGGHLSDEYQLLPFTQAVTENAAFQRRLQSEELLEVLPDGVVIGQCPDGDAILLCKDGPVIRFSHEAPEITGQWPSLAQFIVDAIHE